jgi:hypothetical protein
MSTTTEDRSTRTTMEAKVARVFGLEGEQWMRHANPLSVWSRFSCVSLLALAVWSRTWIGWFCLVPLVLTWAWMMLNPRLFPEPRSTRSWASKGVFGERIWSSGARATLPQQFRSRIPNLVNLYSAIGLGLLVYGLVTFNLLAVVSGILITHGGKLWYIDRMVLLFEDMKGRDDAIARWER